MPVCGKKKRRKKTVIGGKTECVLIPWEGRLIPGKELMLKLVKAVH